MTDCLLLPMNSVARSIDAPLLDIEQRQNLLLADDYVSYTTTRDRHWNITEEESRRLHQQLQAQYAKTDGMLRAFLASGPPQQNLSKTIKPRFHHE